MADVKTTGERASRAGSGFAPWVGLGIAVILLITAFTLPTLLDWEVYARRFPEKNGTAEPLHGFWDPRWFGPGTIPALVLGLLAVRYAAPLAARLRWRTLLVVAYLTSVVWMLSLAFIDGTRGVSRVLDSEFEYYAEAPGIDSIPAMLEEFISRIPYAHPDNWVVHVAGHPPGALLFYVVLFRIGLQDPLWAGLATSVLAATSIVAVLITLRLLGAEKAARTAAPFLALSPSLIFVAVSGDGVFAAFAAWGLAALAAAAVARHRATMVGFAALAGLLLGYCVMLSYGLPLLGLLAVAVLIAARGSWWPMPIAALVALAVVLSFVPFGYAWWEAYPVLVERYWDGAASIRPFSYWVWGNLAALLISAGPMIGSGVAALVAHLRHPRSETASAHRVVLLLAGAAVLIIVAADLSRMSKSEVERIWLPFIPWLTLSLVLLPPKWRTPALAVQVATALIVETLMYTSW
ncbi:MAG: hypothetical protein WBG36_14905 [Ornithinimicrobium sp.]